MAVVFSTLFKLDLKTFAIFLFAGMIPWNFFNAVVTQSGRAYIDNESLIKKIYLPKMIFPLSISLALLIDSLLSFVALFMLIIGLGGALSWPIIFLPVAFFLLFLFSFGMGLAMSIWTVYFRDLQHITLIAMQGIFFLSPVLYKKDLLTGSIGWVVGLNPINAFIELFRAPLYEASLPQGHVILQAVLLSVLSLAFGVFVFLRHEKRIIFRL